MGSCQSRPAVDRSRPGAERTPSAPETPSSMSTAAATTPHNKRSLFRRRPSESSVVTIIPEATEEDLLWNDADSLTGGCAVYDGRGHNRKNRKDFPTAAAASVSSPSVQQGAAVSTPSTEASSTLVTAPSASLSSPEGMEADSYDDEYEDEDEGSGGGAESTPGGVAGTTLSSFTPYSLVSPTPSGGGHGAALAPEYEDDDSTAMVIEEEEDPTAPSDEDEDENGAPGGDDDPGEPGRLVPSNAAAAAPSSTRRLSRLPRLFRSSSKKETGRAPSQSAASSPLSGELRSSPTPSAGQILAGATIVPSVDPHTLSHFHRLELQAKLARQAQTRRAKELKYRDRHQDVQGYKQLWREYEQLQQWEREQQQAATEAVTQIPLGLADPDHSDSAEGAMAFASPAAAPAGADDKAPSTEPLPQQHRRQIFRGRRGGSSSSADRRRSRAQSFDLHDASNWYFDFQAVDFAYEGVPQDRLQSSLSLLSESSLEAQRRLYAEKRRLRRRNKKHRKLSSKSKSSKASSSQTSIVLATDAAAEAFSPMVATPRRDYGPVRSSASVQSAPLPSASRLHPSSSDFVYSASADRAAPAEWVDQEIQCDASSCLSDMGETASYTSNDYRVPRRSARHYFGYGSSGSTSATTDKLAELEAKVQALQERNAELAAVAAAAASSSSQASYSSPRTDVAASNSSSSSSPSSSDPPLSADTAKTPVATNGVASLRRRFEASQDVVRALHSSPEKDLLAAPITDVKSPFEAAQHHLMAYQLGRVVADESSEMEPDESMLSAIEESMTSFASSTVPSESDKVPSPLGKSSPSKSLLSDAALAFPSLDLNCPSGEEELVLLAVPDESIDAPPAEECPACAGPESFVPSASASPSPRKTRSSSEAPPSLLALDTSSTVSASEDENEPTERGEEKKDDAEDELHTPVKAAAADKGTETPVQSATGPSKLDSSPASNDEEDIFDQLARGELDATADADDDTTNSEAKPADPPGKAMLDGTPSLEIKRRPWENKPKAGGVDPVAPIGWNQSSIPTPIGSPSRQSSISPYKSRSPLKNRWIAELSTSEFLAMSEENALERLSRIEHREVPRTKLSLYGGASDDSETDETVDVEASGVVAIDESPLIPEPQAAAKEENSECEVASECGFPAPVRTGLTPEELVGISDKPEVGCVDNCANEESPLASVPDADTDAVTCSSLDAENRPETMATEEVDEPIDPVMEDSLEVSEGAGLEGSSIDDKAPSDANAATIPSAVDSATEKVVLLHIDDELLREASLASEVAAQGDSEVIAASGNGEVNLLQDGKESTDEIAWTQAARLEKAVDRNILDHVAEFDRVIVQAESLVRGEESQRQDDFEHPQDECAADAEYPATAVSNTDDLPAIGAGKDLAPLQAPSPPLLGHGSAEELGGEVSVSNSGNADVILEEKTSDGCEAVAYSMESVNHRADEAEDELCASFELHPCHGSGVSASKRQHSDSPTTEDGLAEIIGTNEDSKGMDFGLQLAPIAGVANGYEKAASGAPIDDVRESFSLPDEDWPRGTTVAVDSVASELEGGRVAAPVPSASGLSLLRCPDTSETENAEESALDHGSVAGGSESHPDPSVKGKCGTPANERSPPPPDVGREPASDDDMRPSPTSKTVDGSPDARPWLAAVPSDLVHSNKATSLENAMPSQPPLRSDAAVAANSSLALAEEIEREVQRVLARYRGDKDDDDDDAPDDERRAAALAKKLSVGEESPAP